MKIFNFNKNSGGSSSEMRRRHFFSANGSDFMSRDSSSGRGSRSFGSSIFGSSNFLASSNGSSALSMGAHQRLSISAGCKSSGFLDKDGKATQNPAKEYHHYDAFEQTDTEDYWPSSAFGSECKNENEHMEDFVIPIAPAKVHPKQKTLEKQVPLNDVSRREVSNKKRHRSDREPRRRSGVLRSLKMLLRKSLKAPLDKKHQRWSRFSFDSRKSFESVRSSFARCSSSAS